jgi:hypothetical protein
MGKSIYMPYGAEDTTAQMERVHLLEELYIRDGRDIPEHPWNGRYTGLYLKYYRAPDSSPD